VAYANGLVKERVLDQFEKIQEIQKRFKIKIFKGIEADILSEGDLDYDQDFLLRFDFVIGSLHNALGQEESKMTSRVHKALKNPLLDFFGHPTGRLLLGRAAAKFDVAEMINLAVKNNVVVELNANPQRLDLDWRYGKRLKELGGKVSVNPDAHSIAALEDVEFGINVARKGWLESEQIINTLPVDKVLQALKGYSARQH
jgi:DNA polymerase (family 10)